MLYKYKVDGDDFNIWRIVRHGGDKALLKNQAGNTTEVPYRSFCLNQHHLDTTNTVQGEQKEMGNPTNLSKKSLLKAIDELNTKFVEKGKLLRIKSKPIQEICDLTATAVAQMNHVAMIEEMSDTTMAELVAWGITDKDFYGEEDIPDGLQMTLDKITDDTVQAEESLKVNFTVDNSLENEGDTNDTSSTDADTDKTPGGTDNSKLIASLEKKVEKAKKKGKDKKVKKLLAEIGKLLAIQSEEPVPEKKKEKKKKPPEVNPRIKEIEDEIETLKDDMPEKKKKAKKQQKKITELAKELANLVTASGLDETESKPKTGIKRGANARAEKAIPDKITWPKSGSITGTIVKACLKEPVTIKQIHKKMKKAFPDKPTSSDPKSGMFKTLEALVGGVGTPLPLSSSKGLIFEVENDGTSEKTVHCISIPPEDW